MFRSSKPCAKKVVDLKSNKTIVANNEALQKILLQPGIENKPVCVISITGTFRQGKSFLLNFLLRYLHLKYKMKKTVGSKWLSPEDGDISGFEWKCGKERHTMGILMWSEVFLAELPTGREVAIVILDTQGTFDNKTTKHHCAAIFAISTLISSVQIFNVKMQIDQSALEYLECFAGYGHMAVNQNSTEAPFQKLCFLIRDWQYPYQNSYGASGGDQYLDEYLNSGELPEELRNQNEKIKTLFKEMSCFLLPHPGNKVALEPTFRGEMKDIDSEFLRQVEQFVLTILAPENLLPKTVDGRELKVKDLVNFFQSYCHFFMSENVPALESMYLATANAQLGILLNEAKEQYEHSMNLLIIDTPETLQEDDFEIAHLQRAAEANQYLTRKKIMGDDLLKESFKAELDKFLAEKFIEYRKINDIKLEKERQYNEIKQEWKQTEERILGQLDNQKEEYERILQQKEHYINASVEKQQELIDKMSQLQESIEKTENEYKKQKSEMQNKIRSLENDYEELKNKRSCTIL